MAGQPKHPAYNHNSHSTKQPPSLTSESSDIPLQSPLLPLAGEHSPNAQTARILQLQRLLGNRAVGKILGLAQSKREDKVVDSLIKQKTAKPDSVIQAQFVLAQFYAPQRDDIEGHMNGHPAFLRQGTTYKVVGFDFNNNVILLDTETQMKFGLNKDLHQHFQQVNGVLSLPQSIDITAIQNADLRRAWYLYTTTDSNTQNLLQQIDGADKVRLVVQDGALSPSSSGGKRTGNTTVELQGVDGRFVSMTTFMRNERNEEMNPKDVEFKILVQIDESVKHYEGVSTFIHEMTIHAEEYLRMIKRFRRKTDIGDAVENWMVAESGSASAQKQHDRIRKLANKFLENDSDIYSHMHIRLINRFIELHKQELQKRRKDPSNEPLDSTPYGSAALEITNSYKEDVDTHIKNVNL